jgi:hypothetical protein
MCFNRPFSCDQTPRFLSFPAFCLNSSNGRWYCFDDQQVSPVEESEVVTKDAYMLFYQRRTPRYVPSVVSHSTSIGGSSTLPPSFPSSVAKMARFSGGKADKGCGPGGWASSPGNRLSGTLPASWQYKQHHWVYRIPGLKPVGEANGKGGG